MTAKSALLAAGAALTLAGPAAAGDLAECLAGYKPPANTTVTEARVLTTPTAHCRLDGYVTTNNPGPNRVRFMLALPETWNGRYLFTVQGAAGQVADPAEAQLRAGYAIAATDKGVGASGGLDPSANPGVALDWAHRGVHVAAQATQAITRNRYGRERIHRYIVGCSGGGDAALTEAELYPGDFDAHVAGAMNTDYPSGSTLVWAAIGQRLHTVPGAWISPAEFDQIHAALMAKYDRQDGAVDGLIWDPRVIRFDAADRQALGFLSEAQWGTIKLIQDGVSDLRGQLLAPGFWWGDARLFPSFLTGRTPPPWKTAAEQPSGWTVAEAAGKARNGAQFSYATGADFSRIDGPIEGLTGTKFDHRKLVGLRDAGGKLILWVGAAGEAVAPQQVTGYADKASKTFGGVEARQQFLRAFVIPGLHHCGRGAAAPTDAATRLLEAAQDWVEKGIAPDQVRLSNAVAAVPARAGAPAIAARAATRSFLICPYPQRSVFTGGPNNPAGLDVNDAGAWSCKAPAVSRAPAATVPSPPRSTRGRRG